MRRKEKHWPWLARKGPGPKDRSDLRWRRWLHAMQAQTASGCWGGRSQSHQCCGCSDVVSMWRGAWPLLATLASGEGEQATLVAPFGSQSPAWQPLSSRPLAGKVVDWRRHALLLCLCVRACHYRRQRCPGWVERDRAGGNGPSPGWSCRAVDEISSVLPISHAAGPRPALSIHVGVLGLCFVPIPQHPFLLEHGAHDV